MIRLIKKSRFLIITFFVISFLSLIIIYTMQKGISMQMDNKEFLSDETISFNCSRDNGISDKTSENADEDYSKDKNDIASSKSSNHTNGGDENIGLSNELLNLDGDYILLREDDMRNKALFFKGQLKDSPKMISGRFFEEDDFNKGEKCIVVGKDKASNIVNKDGEDMYFFEGDYYRVIGVIGDLKEKKLSDYQVFINLDSLLRKNNSYIEGNYKIDAKTNTNKVYDNVKLVCNENSIKVKETENENNFIKQYINGYVSDTVKYVLEIVCVLVINIFLIAKYWINSRRREIGIKRTLGATRLRISSRILFELLSISIVSYSLGYMVFLIVSRVKDGYFHFYGATAISVLCITVISAILSCIIPIRNAVKMEPSEVIR